jgi:hypothetical protein
MGMPIVLDVCDAEVEESALEQAFEWLRHVDATFSTYRTDSEVSRLNRGELTLERCSPLVRTVLMHCERLHAATDGYFDHRAAATWGGARPEQPGCRSLWVREGVVDRWCRTDSRASRGTQLLCRGGG